MSDPIMRQKTLFVKTLAGFSILAPLLFILLFCFIGGSARAEFRKLSRTPKMNNFDECTHPGVMRAISMFDNQRWGKADFACSKGSVFRVRLRKTGIGGTNRPQDPRAFIRENYKLFGFAFSPEVVYWPEFPEGPQGNTHNLLQGYGGYPIWGTGISASNTDHGELYEVTIYEAIRNPGRPTSIEPIISAEQAVTILAPTIRMITADNKKKGHDLNFVNGGHLKDAPHLWLYVGKFPERDFHSIVDNPPESPIPAWRIHVYYSREPQRREKYASEGGYIFLVNAKTGRLIEYSRFPTEL